jgi:hypothetical protein
MIDYLEQLERDLVDAIDRRDAAPARRRSRRPAWRGRDWAPAVTTAILLLVIAGAVALVERTTSPPEVEQGQPRPMVTLQLTEALAPIEPDVTLRARARGPGGVGTLTIEPTRRLVVQPCCEKPARPAPVAARTPFSWTSARGSLSGCIANTVSRTPDGRYLWDGVARITSATGALRAYRGFDLNVAGEVQPSALRPARAQSRKRLPLVSPPTPTRC